MSQLSLQALSAIDLFAVLPPAERQRFATLAVIRRFEAKQTLFEEGQPCEGIWVIASGSIRIYKFTPGGRQIVLAVQEAPATVAEVPVFDGGPYPATAITQEPSEAMLIRKDDFLACCRRNPELTLKILNVFSARLRHLVGFVERVTFGSIRQRLAQALVEMADAHGASFALAETHEDLANRLGTVREVVSRNLGRFQSEGLIRLHRKDVQILNREGLAAEAETTFKVTVSWRGDLIPVEIVGTLRGSYRSLRHEPAHWLGRLFIRWRPCFCRATPDSASGWLGDFCC